MLNPQLSDRQTVLMKSGLDQDLYNEIQFIAIKTTCLWPKFLGHFVLNRTCFYTGPKPNQTDLYALIESSEITQTLSTLQETFPALTYVDVALIAQQLSESKLFHHFSFSELLKAFRLHSNLDLEHILNLIALLPPSAQNHLHEKKWQWGDLQIFLSVKNLDQVLISAIESLFSFGLSKSEMAQCCELLIECWLAKTPIEIEQWNAVNIKGTLLKLRFPQRDVLAPAAIQQPIKNIQIKPMRQNDRKGFEFKFFSANATELDKIIKKLQQAEMEWQTDV